jgi:two-component system sensor histidine kinase PrrB
VSSAGGPIATGRHRPLSLRARVAVASALGTTLVVLVFGGGLVALLARQSYAELDDRIDAIASVASADLAQRAVGTSPGQGVTRVEALAGEVARALDAPFVGLAYRDGDLVAGLVTDGAAPDLPAQPPGRTTLTTQRGTYRVLTRAVQPARDVTIAFALPTDATELAVTRAGRAVAALGLLAVGGAAALGWGLAGPAVRPLRALRDRALAVDPAVPGAGVVGLRAGDVRGAREAAELADALAGMLGRLEGARRETEEALRTARDFAATAGHELRTPLTAMRTDLDVLRAHPDLSEADRQEVLADLAAAQRRVETTLAALGQLARGDLADVGGFTEVDLGDLLARAVEDARRGARGVALTLTLPPGELVIRGWAAGLRLAVDNMLTNAVRHARATRIDVGLEQAGGRVLIRVDDDGMGVPAAERAVVFGRFARGSGAAPGGSGLGLALVAQQAALHGGSARLETSPLGGTRAVLAIAADPPPNPHPHPHPR